MSAVVKNYQRLVHLDLKGSPLKISFLEKFFPYISNHGATGLLIEWEDTFPYADKLTGIGSFNTPSNAYSIDEVQYILSLAHQSNLMVIPLIQTMGHLEFVLKHDEWKNLREVEQDLSCLCPSQVPDSINLVTTMLDQVMKTHLSLSAIHIGADEVWNVGICERCKNENKHRLFLNHVQLVVNHLRNKYSPSISIIMWDDMLRSVDVELLKEYDIWDVVQPMIWHYQSAENFQLNNDLWKKYAQVFQKVWVASAFKGASGSCQLLPCLPQHASNHQHWAKIVLDSEFTLQIQGIALTGWSRYDHYAILCELLPVAIPSLILCLKVWLETCFTSQILADISELLGYPPDYCNFLIAPPRPLCSASKLNFPGWQILVGVEWFVDFKGRYSNLINSDHFTSWLNPWQRKNNFLNPMQTNCIIKRLFELKEEINSIAQYLHCHMPEVYYNSTIDEWFGSIIEPVEQNLRKIIDSLPERICGS